ncbi:MAG: chromosomal replication initiator protein DnaA [Deltaproteobacteria bacterium]|jgi:chromosomal replication initiator protein|nr:chromosomal replication initiator protein DnaA [Deltaproteobacteria bacterium]
MPDKFDGTGQEAPVLGRVWPETKTLLAGSIPVDVFKTWIEPLNFEWQGEQVLNIISPNEFFLKYLIEHYKSAIEETVTELCQKFSLYDISVNFTYSMEEKVSSADYLESSLELLLENDSKYPQHGKKGKGHVNSFNPDFTFDSFVVGSTNNLAYWATKAFCEDNKLGHNFLFLTSENGLGKSHLSQALGQSLLSKKPELKVIYLTAEDFTNEMTKSLNDKIMEAFKRKFRVNCDILMLEYVPFLACKPKIQEELVLTLDFLVDQGKKVIFTSTIEPKNIPNIGRSLRSRFNSSLVAPIEAPDYETRLEILKRKAQADGLALTTRVLEFIASRVTSDVRQLKSCITGLASRALLLGKSPDLEMARECISIVSSDGEGGLTVRGIFQYVCDTYKVQPDILASESRVAKVSEARSMGMYLAKTFTKSTLQEIGRVFCRSHPSVSYAITKVARRIDKDPQYSRQVDLHVSQLTNLDLQANKTKTPRT